MCIPKGWRRMCFAIKAMLTLLVTARLHALRWGRCYFSAADLFEDAHDADPDRLQIIVADEVPPRRVTLAEIEQTANRVANWCHFELKLEAGDTLALMMHNTPEFISFWIGAAKVCLATALINTNATGKGLLHSVLVATKSCKSSRKILVVDEECYRVFSSDSVVSQGFADMGVVVFTWQKLSSPGGALALASKARPNKMVRKSLVKESDALLYIFTSGTTGMPKASKISHSRFYLSTLPLAEFCRLGPKDRIYSPLPLFHSAAGMLGVGAALRAGSTLVIRKKFSVKHFSKDCFDHGVTCMQYIGELCRFLAKCQPNELDSQLQIVNAFGNGLSRDVWEAFQQRYRIKHIVEFYASTEGNVVLFNATDKVGALGFVPRIVDFLYPTRLVKPDVDSPEIPFRDENGRCHVSLECDVGLLVGPIDVKRCDRRFDGYTDGQETQKKILRGVFKDEDTYFNSGDLMYRDGVGYFFWSDRTGDTFRWRGENCSTSQIASVVSDVKGVAECAVYGIAVPGNEGRCGMASISFDQGVTIANFDFAALVQVQRSNLANQSFCRFLRVVQEIPKTSTYKHQKADLVKAGFDLSLGPVFFLNKSLIYVELTREVLDDLDGNLL